MREPKTVPATQRLGRIAVGKTGCETMKIFFIVLEALIIAALLFYIIWDALQKKALTERAELIKRRRMDFDDIDVGTHNNSVAVLAGSLNVIKNNLQAFLESIKVNVVVLSDAIGILSQGADLNQENSRRISENLSTVANKVEEQYELVKSCLDLVVDNTGKLTDIDGSVKEIGDLLAETVKSCESGVDSMEKYENNMMMISENLDRSEQILADFSQKINEINEIGSFIVGISQSLKMLALNASIEAARVGAAGSGFAVVATEMGEMSTKTQESIVTINEILGNVVESSNLANQCIRDSAKMFEEGRKEFDAVSASFRTIDEQDGVINNKMKEILAAIEEITKNSLVTKTRAEQAYRNSEEITSGTQEIAQVSEKTSEVSQKVTENVGTLNSILTGLEQLLRQFTTAVEPVKFTPQKKIKIGFICMDDNDFWHAVRRGAIYAKKELEAQGAEVRYHAFSEWNEVVLNREKFLTDMVKENFDGYVMPGFLVGGVMPIVESEMAKGKKVYLINNDTEDKRGRNGVFQPDTADASALAAKIMANTLNKKGNVMIYEGSREVVANCIRSDTFKECIANYKGIKLDVVHAKLSEEDTYLQVKDYLQTHPDVNGIYVTTGTPAAVARAVEESKLKVKLVVFDHSQDIFRYIKKGIIAAAIGQDPFGQGHDPVVWMYNSIVTGEKLPSENMKCRASVVDKTNVDNLLEC